MKKVYCHQRMLKWAHWTGRKHCCRPVGTSSFQRMAAEKSQHLGRDNLILINRTLVALVSHSGCYQRCGQTTHPLGCLLVFLSRLWWWTDMCSNVAEKVVWRLRSLRNGDRSHAINKDTKTCQWGRWGRGKVRKQRERGWGTILIP